MVHQKASIYRNICLEIQGQTNGLYLSVVLTKIKEPAVLKEAVETENPNEHTLLVADSNINITQLFAYVNPLRLYRNDGL